MPTASGSIAAAAGASQDEVWRQEMLFCSIEYGTNNLYDVIGRSVLDCGNRIYNKIQQENKRYRTQPKANIQQYTTIYRNIQRDSARKQRYRTHPKANIQQYTARMSKKAKIPNAT